MLVGGFNHFLFLPPLGEDSHFDEYVSDGLKPPNRNIWFPWDGSGNMFLMFPVGKLYRMNRPTEILKSTPEYRYCNPTDLWIYHDISRYLK